MMLKTCSNCGQNFLTEVALFVYQHRPTEEYYSCGCKEQADVAKKCAEIVRTFADDHKTVQPSFSRMVDAICKHFNLKEV